MGAAQRRYPSAVQQTVYEVSREFRYNDGTEQERKSRKYAMHAAKLGDVVHFKQATSNVIGDSSQDAAGLQLRIMGALLWEYPAIQFPEAAMAKLE